ncbi:MAG TPA: alpha/beta hydrolase [Rudaea sp.]|nr:alpha/beta hydrolase [Rudaea sp.]
MTKRNVFRIAVAVAFLAFVVYGQLRPKLAGDAAPARALLPPVPTNAKAFTLGKLQFKACELTQKRSGATTAAYCAPFQVPEDPDAPGEGGRRIDLNLALIKAEAEAADSDFVVFLAGGPGQAAIENWPQVAPALAPLRRHHHIVLLDQRGTGGSHTLTCERAADDQAKPDDSAEAGANLDEVRRATRACLAQVERNADPRYYTTTAAVRDLEAVRQALGAPQFDLVGVSYGTRVAQQYLMRHPDGVRSVVLDSVVPNEVVLGEEFAENLEQALKAQFSLCTQVPVCAKAFPDPYASLIRLRNELRAKPQSYDFRDPVTFAPAHGRLDDYTLAGLVRLFAYTPETAALLPLSIAEGLKGNYTPLAGQSQLLTGDLSELRDNGMQTSVVCAEDADLLTSRPQDAGTVLGTALVDVIRTQCEIWPRGTRPADFHAPLKSGKPVLVLEGEFDPVTPPKYGDQVMRGLTNARLLVAKGQGHNVIGRGCIPKLVQDFVDRLAPKQLDTRCADVLGPTPAFIGFNGAAP